MPSMSQGMETGIVVRWLKREGDHVERGEPIAEIETDKATMEMEALVRGTLIEIVRHEGEEVPVGNPIAAIESAS